MKYIIDPDLHEPAYIQLYDQLKNDIIKELYPYNTKIPSKRLMAAETDLSTVTVEHSYSLLADEGYIESRERSGYFVIFRKDAGFAASADRKEFVAPAVAPVISDLPAFPLSVLKRTMRSVMNDYGEAIMERSPNYGTKELREAIRRYLARSRGIEADIDQIIIGSGSEYFYGMLVEFFGRNIIYAIENPSYKKIEQVYTACDVKLEKLPLGADGIKSSALNKTHAGILHISPFRSFPSEVTATASKRHEYLRWASVQNRYIIEDDFESEFSVSGKPEETLFAQSENDNVFYMNTFSKTVSTSLRAGYMVIPLKCREEFRNKLGFYSCTVPTFIQFVLAELIMNGDFERHINRLRRAKRKQK